MSELLRQPGGFEGLLAMGPSTNRMTASLDRRRGRTDGLLAVRLELLAALAVVNNDDVAALDVVSR